MGVCQDQFRNTDAQVACRQMGHMDGKAKYRGPNGEGKVWMDDTRCTGQENRLQDCQFISDGHNFDCPGHELDVSVRCKKCSNKSDAEARLVDKRGKVLAGAGVHSEKMPGIATRNTQCSQCRTCPPGKFGGCFEDNDTICEQCSSCPHGQRKTGGCSGNMDTKCSKAVPVFSHEVCF